MKRIKAFIVLIAIVLSAGLTCGLNSFAGNRSNVYAGSDEKQCFYLKDGASVKKNTTQVGTASGYGTFNLGFENVVLTANALDGYKVVGWYVKNAGTAELITASKALDLDSNGSTDVNLIVDYADANFLDGEVDNSTLTISKVYADLEIEPVFDYIYYSLDLTDTSIANYFDVTGAKSAYKLGESVSLTLTPKASVGRIGVEGLKNNGEAIPFTNDSTDGVTSQLTTNFNITKSVDLKNTLSCEVSKVFKATISVTTSDNEKVSEITNQIMTNGLFSYYSKVTGETAVYVKADNFQVTCPENYAESVDSTTYTYYTFTSLDGDVNRSKEYNGLTADITINIVYSAYEYKIEFLPLIKIGAIYSADVTGVNVLTSKMVARGASLTTAGLQTELDALGNTGYTFVGYTADINVAPSNDIATLSLINSIKPEGKTIYMCFEYVDYQIDVTNLTNITLNDGTNTYIPYQSIKVTVGDVSENVNLSDYSLSLTAHINDTIKFAVTMNDGFKLVGITADSAPVTDFVVTKAYLETPHTSIEIGVSASYTAYTITYFVDVQNNGTQNDIYATISTSNSITRNVGEEIAVNSTNSTETGLTDKVKQIVISNLHKYDEVKFIATANTIPGTSQKYHIRDFLYNGTYASNPDINADEYSYTLKVKENATVEVECTTPRTALEITFRVDDEILPSFVAVADITVATSGGNVAIAEGYYGLDVGTEYTITLGQLPFGYKIVGRDLYTTNGVSVNTVSTDASNSNVFTFTVAVGEVHTLYFNFQTIKYKFAVVQNGAGLTDEIFDFGGNNYVELSVKNSTLTFAKPIGYYVKTIAVDTIALPAENASVFSNNYSQDLLDKLSQIASADEIVNISVVYEIYKYSISIEYSGFGTGVTLPTITLTGVEGITFNKTSSAFENIPYGSTIILTVNDDFALGYIHTGWAKGTEILSYEKSYTLSNLTENKELKYVGALKSYNIKLSFNSLEGTPSIVDDNDLTNVKANYVKLNDKRTINAGANTNLGYSFVSYKYKKYVEYKDGDFESVYNTLYIFKYGEPQLNTSNVEQNGIKYYLVENVVKTDETLKISKFSPLDFYSDASGEILITISYEKARLKIVNTINKGADMEAVGSNPAVTIANADIASIVMKSQDGIVITQDNAVTIDDTIIVEIQLNKNCGIDFPLTTNEVKHFDLDLYGLVQLKELKIANGATATTFADAGAGKYTFSFDVRDFIESALATNQITIDYTFGFVTNYAVAVSTNFHDSSFYTKNDIKIKLGNNSYSSKKDAYTLSKCNALSKLAVSYNNGFAVDANNNKLLDISKIKVYSLIKPASTFVKGDYICTLSSDEDLMKYGVFVLTKDGYFQVEICLLKSVYIEFVVEPIVTVNGEAEDDAMIITKTFKCDATANPVAQTLTAGVGEDKDIKYANEVFGDVTIAYYKETNGVKSAYKTDPTVCGRYYVEITFSEASGEMSWLKDFKLSQIIILKVVPMEISVTALSVGTSQKLSMIYGSSIPMLDLTLLQYENADKSFVLNCGSAGNILLKLSSTYQALTSTVEGKETRVSDNSKHAKASDGEYYNYTVYGLTISNSNFVLKQGENAQTQVTILGLVKVEQRELLIAGLEVYDKVYDGTTEAYVNENSNASCLSNAIAGDDVKIDFSKLVLRFDSAEIGTNKQLRVDATNALSGNDASNYKIGISNLTGYTIYPDKISTIVRNVGTVTVYNEIGKTDHSKANLIPINATLSVETISHGSNMYYKLYRYFGNKITRRTKYNIGYSLRFVINGTEQALPSGLTVSFPTINKLAGSMYVGDDKYGDLQYSVNDDRIVVNLSTISDTEVDKIFFFSTKLPIKLWQIILFISLLVLIIVAIVVILVTRRKRKRELFASLNEKI